MSLVLIVALPFLLAPAAWACGRRSPAVAASVAVAAPLASLAFLIPQVTSVLAGGVPTVAWAWLPQAGLSFSLRLDAWALTMALLVLVIGILVAIYAAGYLGRSDPPGRFYAFFLLFMGAMLGVALAGNLILLAVFWELTSLSSFLLIGFWHGRREARAGARMALAVTGLGGLALLAGLMLLGVAAGSFELGTVLAAGPRVKAHELYPAILGLVLVGAFSKSAQVPLQFWLPRAMAAPTPVSAYLHSATMVKAGVFLLARLYPVLVGPQWTLWVTTIGLVTAALGAYWAIFQRDLKGLLAYSTISHLGIITACFGFATRAGVIAGVLHLINHAAFKAGLFMTAGAVDHGSGTRDLARLGGLRQAMPYTTAVAVVGALAMAGIPPLGGFISKELFVDAALAAGPLAALAAAFAALCGVVYAARYAHGTFGGAARDAEVAVHAHEGGAALVLPPALLVAAALLFGLIPGLIEPLVVAAASAVTGEAVGAPHLALWHGLTPALGMSVAAIVLGAVAYRAWEHLPRIALALSGERAFTVCLAATIRGARVLVAALIPERTGAYIAWILGAIALALGSGLAQGPLAGTRPITPPDAGAFVAWLLLVAGAVGTVLWRGYRIAAVVAAGVVGLASVLAFARLSAPDLALTQLSVEVVTVVLLLLALGILPLHGATAIPRRVRGLAATLALAVGGTVGLAAWAVMTRTTASISAWHLEQSIPGGGGSNVVNVTLVDFRGFDTMGEITVLAIAALGIFAMIQGLRIPLDANATRGLARDRHPLILTVLTRPLLPVALTVALYIFLRGHNQPGGGFVAGLITAVALSVQYLASGADWAGERLKFPFEYLLVAGLTIAGLTGLGAWIWGRPFLTSAHGHVHLPLIGDVELATAALFDLGVFLVVVGATLMMLTRLSRIRERDPDAELKLAATRDPWKP